MGGEIGAVLSAVCMVLLGLLAFLGRNVMADLRDHESKLANQDKALAVMDAGRIGDRVQKLESDMNEIKSDLRVIRSWVEGQENNRRGS